MYRFIIRLLTSCALLGCTLIAPFTMAATSVKLTPPERITSVEGITEYRLSNGLRVLLFPDVSTPTITVNITYIVGSRHEGYGESGMAHLLEHMVFKGTPRFPNIWQELTAHGARPNGTTYYDRTNYFEIFAATDDNLRWALDLESDRMINSFIAEKDLKSEFSVVRNEFERGENNPDRVLQERVMSSAYLWHNYGRSVIGSREDIERVPVANLQAFYKKYYQPDNAVLTIAGKFDEAKTLSWVNEFFGKIPKPTRILQPTYTVEPVQDGERHVTLRRVGDVQITAAAYHIPAATHPDFAAVDVLTEVLTNEPSGRLYKALIDTQKASSVEGEAFDLKDPSIVYFSAEVLKDKSIAEASSTMLNVLDTLKNNPVTEQEVQRAKNRWLKFFNQTLNNSERVGLNISEYIAKGDWRLAFYQRDQVEKVTAVDVNRVAATYFKPTNRTTGLFSPETDSDRATITAAAEPALFLKDYKGKETLKQAEKFDSSPENIIARTRSEKLPGGAQYIFLSKSTRGSKVTATITLRLGSVASLENKAMIATLTASMLRRGTQTRSLEQINEQLDKLKSSIGIGGSGQNVNINILSTRENLQPTMEIVADILRNPIFLADEFAKIRQEMLAEIEQQRSDPGAIASQEFSQTLYPYDTKDFRRTLTVDELVTSLKSINTEDLRKFHADFYGSTQATAAVVGDFDETTTRGALGAILSNWTAPLTYKRAASLFFDVPMVVRKINTPDKTNAVMRAGVNLPLRDDQVDYPALVIANYILGGGSILNSRLAVRIRQQEGISYGVGSFLQASSLDVSGIFGVQAIYNPKNSDKLMISYREEIQKVLSVGFTDKEVQEACAGWLQGRDVSRSEDNELVVKLSSYLFLNRTLEWDAAFDKQVSVLTAAQVNAAVKRWIKLDNISIIEAGDFTKNTNN